MKPPELGGLPNAPLGVAVSGGGDSVALLMLLHRAGHKLHVATVDHQLRPDSAAEAIGVAKLCAQLLIPHEILVWQDPILSGNLQNAARLARRHLLGNWANTKGIADIVLGHTLDDQAETVLMRLARGSGVDGLAAMATKRCENGLCWHRPLLGQRRADLRQYLRDINIGWVDDPSNDDLKYDRIKARHALAQLADLGLSPDRLVQTSQHMGRARQALEQSTMALAQQCVEISTAGELRIAAPDFLDAPSEIRLRLLSAALVWVGNAQYRPRFTALQTLAKACAPGQKLGKTLHGCTIAKLKNNIVINREFSATPKPALAQPKWDGRWQIPLPTPLDTQIRALGANGLKFCANWRDTGHSRAALLASPSLWQKDALIAAPLANYGDKWPVNLAGGKKGFYDRLITH